MSACSWVVRDTGKGGADESMNMDIPLPGLQGPACDVQCAKGNESEHDDGTTIHED